MNVIPKIIKSKKQNVGPRQAPSPGGRPYPPPGEPAEELESGPGRVEPLLLHVLLDDADE